MTVALVIMEGIILSFWLLLVCVVGIANGPVGLACFYEKNGNRAIFVDSPEHDSIFHFDTEAEYPWVEW